MTWRYWWAALAVGLVVVLFWALVFSRSATADRPCREEGGDGA